MHRIRQNTQRPHLRQVGSGAESIIASVAAAFAWINLYASKIDTSMGQATAWVRQCLAKPSDYSSMSAPHVHSPSLEDARDGDVWHYNQRCSWRCVTLAAGVFQPGRQRGVLPVVQVSGVSAAVMEIVLDFIYTDLLMQLPEAFMSEGGADELFDAADRYLLFSMKVGPQPHPALSSSCTAHPCAPCIVSCGA